MVPPADATSAVVADAFSAQRAWLDLEAITVEPRVMGTPALGAARVYRAHKFELLGLSPEITDMTSVQQDAAMGVAAVAQPHDLY